jgi:DNA adenine methylase
MNTPIPNAGPCIMIPGGKSRLLKHILPLLPEKIEDYHEPFLGGAAVYLALRREGRIEGQAYLADVNPLLINLYDRLALSPESVELALRGVDQSFNTEEGYYQVRAEVNQWLDWVARDGIQDHYSAYAAGQFLFLVRRGFNGLVRQNRKGHWNVAWGHDTTRQIVFPEQLQGVSAAMASAHLSLQSFEKSLARVGPDSTVYLDPPYVPVGRRSDFVDYSKDGFGMANQVFLATLALECRERGAHVVVSQSAAPVIRELYPEARWTYHEVGVARTISRNKDKGRVKEVILVAK